MTSSTNKNNYSDAVDPMALRQALGQFPTGVTIVTTRDSKGAAVGMTASSFNSLSLTPPLVLWSIDKNTLCFPAFNTCQNYAIHVLDRDQENLSARFASRGGDKFANLDIEIGRGGVPLLNDYCARFECEIEHRYDGGDHVIIVGHVINMDTNEDKSPLIFHRGQYSQIG